MALRASLRAWVSDRANRWLAVALIAGLALFAITRGAYTLFLPVPEADAVY